MNIDGKPGLTRACASCGRLSRIRDIQLLHPLINHIVDRSCFIAASAIESFKQSKYMTRISLGYRFWHGEGGKDGPG